MTGRSNHRMRFALGTLSLLCLLATMAISSQAARAEELIFPLEEVSVFDLLKETGQQFLIGHRAVCGDKPDPNVAGYPKFASGQPIYGQVSFGDPLRAKDSVVYHFALDESGGPNTGYDRLYFDLNRDRNLTNDSPLGVRKDLPQGAILDYSEVKQQTCFESLAIPFAYGSEGERPLEMMPRLIVNNNGFNTLRLVTTKARKGRIEIAGQRLDVLLGHCYGASGWFDQPHTALHLIPAGNSRLWDWWGGDRLNATHQIAGKFYTFAATPTGDKLTVRPYEGPLGVFEVGAGGRSLDRFEITGSLRSQKTAVAVGEPSNNNRPTYARSCRLPVGDYVFEYVTLEYGKLRISISSNYHTDSVRRGMTESKRVYGIAIREDKPFVFDFSNKPAVMFASPARDHRLKRGEELSVMAVLTDPVHGFMIRGLDVAGQGRGSLDPKVTIARSNGEIVAEGVMPFG